MMGIASSMGVMTSQLERLLAGQVSLGVSGRLGVMQSDVQRFIDGDVGLGMARSLGAMRSSAQEMRNRIGRDAAIGVIIGLCIDRRSAA